MHPVSTMMNSPHYPVWAGDGPKAPPSAPPAIPPIIINPFSREAPRQSNIDPLRTPLPPPVRPPRLPGFRLHARLPVRRHDEPASGNGDPPHSLD